MLSITLLEQQLPYRSGSRVVPFAKSSGRKAGGVGAMRGRPSNALDASSLASASRLAPVPSEVCEQDHDGARLGAISMAGNEGGALPVDDVVRRVEGGVDPAAPSISAAIGGRGQLELEPLPVRREHDVKERALRPELRRERDAVRKRTPVRSAQLDAVPGNVGTPDQLVEGHALPLGLDVTP